MITHKPHTLYSRSVRNVVIALLLSAAHSTRAETAGAITPPLKPDKDVLRKIEALSPGHGVTLGRASVVGEFNDTAREHRLHETGPRARDFTLKMCWAPDRRRALFCGANHAVPHRLNDVWEFDLPSLTWVMLYAPDLPRGYMDLGKDASDVVYRDGQLRTKRGGPAIIAHSWWGLTYDPDCRSLLFMNTWVTKRREAVERVGGDATDLYAGPPLWAFTPETRAWQPLRTSKPYPRAIFGGLLEYIPDLGGSIWHANNWQMRATWQFDFKKQTWRDLAANGDPKQFEQHAPMPEQIGYYDPMRHLLIVHRHHDTHHYDPRRNVWRKVLSGDRDDGKTPYGHDAHAVLYHDTRTGRGILVQFQRNTLWRYDPDHPSWIQLAPQGDPMPVGRKRLAYFDEGLHVLVVIDGIEVWAYRPE